MRQCGMRNGAMRLLLLVGVLAAAGCASDNGAAAADTARASGHGFAFGPGGGNLVKYDVIFPDRELTATSHDGGVLFLDVNPGRYTLRASKSGAEIRDVTLDCRAGVLANASPPWGLQVEAGGLEPKKPGEKGPFD